MADITHDAAPVTDEGFHEIQLSGKQLVFLFMIAVVVLVATFLLGVQIGRSVKGDRSLDATTADAATVTSPSPAPAASQPAAAASAGPPATEPPAPAPEPEDELSYAKRLQGDKAPPEKLQSPASAAHPAEHKTSESSRASTQAPPSKANAAAAAGGQPGAWVVQLTALKDRGEAAGIATRLTAKGYPAFVLDPVAGEPVYYRVQVGGYADRPQAEQIAHRLEKDEHYKPYVRRR